MKRHTPQRQREYGSRPVKRRAARFPHLAGYFQAEGDRDTAEELCRNLLPAARKMVIGETV